MCYGRCAKYIGYILLVLAVLCIVANSLLYFPNGEGHYASHSHLNPYLGCLPGIIGGGLLVLIPACVFIALKYEQFHDCYPCENRRGHCALLTLVLLAFIGILGAVYCFIMSAMGIANEPYCYPTDVDPWCHPSAGGYHQGHSDWCPCQESKNVAATWDITLFSILLILSGVEVILCVIQIIHGCIEGSWSVCHSDRGCAPAVHQETTTSML